MEQVIATRSELLDRTAQIVLAEQGRDVLKEKRDQLMQEFRKVADVVLLDSEALNLAAAAGRRCLAGAEAAAGPESVRSAASATRREIPLTSAVTTVMGVRVADIDYSPIGRACTDRGYSLAGSSAAIDAAAEQFEAIAAAVLELASKELRLRRLVDEIGKVTRRVNALESVVIPRLRRERVAIQSILDERERQDHFRLKRFTRKRGVRMAVGESS